MTFKPMLAARADLRVLKYPVLASPKLDGVRAVVNERQLLSRSLKPIPNRYIADLLARPKLHGFDGELILGDPWGPTVYRDTVSAVMSRDGRPELRYYVFDLWGTPFNYEERWHELLRLTEKLTLPVDLVESIVIENRAQLDEYEAAAVAKGFEGVMLRSPKAPYKHGRSTVSEGYLLKLKRFEDSEALVIGIEEEMHNANEAQTNELGRTKRSSAKGGLVGKGTMGALVVRDLTTGVEFNIGTGFTAEDRARTEWVGKTVKYKHFPVGTKDKPRHPVYLGLRAAEDLP
jgi:DNA ligase-1